MTETEKITAELLAKAVEKLDEKQKAYILGRVEGMADNGNNKTEG